jgi:hypothetical protein
MAVDANFSKNLKLGAAKVQNIVNATKGTLPMSLILPPKKMGRNRY